MEFFFFFPEIFFFSLLLFYSLQNSLQHIKARQHVFIFTLKYLQSYLTLSKLLQSLYCLLLFLILNPQSWTLSSFLFNGFLITTPTIVILKICIVMFSIILIKSNLFYIFLEKLQMRDFYFFWGFLILFLLLFLHVNDFFLLFVVFEIISLLLYLLLTFYKKLPVIYNTNDITLLTIYQQLLLQIQKKTQFSFLNLYAGIIYFIYNAFFSGFFLFGLSLLFIFFQNSNFVCIFFSFLNYQLFYNFFFFFMLFCFIIFFFFKLSIVPFHWWLSAVYEGSSILTLMFLSIPIKFAYFFIFIKLIIYFFSCYTFWFQQFFIICSIFSLIIGSLGLIIHTKLKKVWAFSTINHMGYLLLSLVCLSFMGFRAFIVYFFTYLISNLFFFLLLQGLLNENVNQYFLHINQFQFLYYHRNKLLGLNFFFFIFSLIGIPPLLGFWGKYLVLCAIYNVFTFKLFLFLFIIILITTLITAFGYLRMWKILYTENFKNKKFLLLPFPIFVIFTKIICIFILIFSFNFFFFSDFFFFLDNLFFFLFSFI
jgi:NADH-quinone oxidoreductase subunit N